MLNVTFNTIASTGYLVNANTICTSCQHLAAKTRDFTHLNPDFVSE